MRSMSISLVSHYISCFAEVAAEIDCFDDSARAAVCAFAPGADPIRDSQASAVIAANRAVAIRRQNSCLP
jgi:hypothetical protein